MTPSGQSQKQNLETVDSSRLKSPAITTLLPGRPIPEFTPLHESRRAALTSRPPTGRDTQVQGVLTPNHCTHTGMTVTVSLLSGTLAMQHVLFAHEAAGLFERSPVCSSHSDQPKLPASTRSIALRYFTLTSNSYQRMECNIHSQLGKPCVRNSR